MKLSPNDLSRLIDGLEGTSHLDETPEEQKHTDELLSRLQLAAGWPAPSAEREAEG